MSMPLILGWTMPLALANGIKWTGDTPHIGWTFKCAFIIWSYLFSFVLHRKNSTCQTGAEWSAWTCSQAQQSLVTANLILTWGKEFLIFINLRDIEVICYHNNQWPITQASNILLANWFDLFPLYDVHPCSPRPWSTWHYPVSLLLNFNFQCFMPWL